MFFRPSTKIGAIFLANHGPNPGISQCIQCSVRSSPVTSVSLTQRPPNAQPPTAVLSMAFRLCLWNLQYKVWFSHNPAINLSATWRSKRGRWPMINNWCFWVSLQEKEKPKGNSLYCLLSTSVDTQVPFPTLHPSTPLLPVLSFCRSHSLSISFVPEQVYGPYMY